MKKQSHFISMLNFCHSHFLTRKVWDISLYSTRANAAKRSPCYDRANKLYRMISPLGDPNASIAPVLDQWVEQVGTLDKPSFVTIIRELRRYRRYKHALELSLWMTDKRYHPLSRGDAAIRLDLIAKVYGIGDAENYLNSLPRPLKCLEVYSALLNCYASAKLVEKAEGILQQMKDMGLLSRARLIYNRLLSMYHLTGNYEKMKLLLQEMEKEDLSYDSYTYCILLSAYGYNSDVNGLENVLKRLECDSEIVLDWHVYHAAGKGYAKAGLLDKALEMLKKSEKLISTMQKKNVTFENLLSQYALMGKRDEVLRVWKLYKTQLKVYNKGYMIMMYSLTKLDDVESAEKVFEEWESSNLSYDLRIPNYLINAYCRKGKFEKAETLVNRVTAKGEKPDARTWSYFTTGYCRQNQFKYAIEAIKKEIIASKPTWDVNKDNNLAAILNYLKGEGDLEGAEEIVNLLRDKDIVSEDFQKRLLSYLKEGESSSTTLIEILGDGVNRNEDTSELAEEEDGNISTNV